MYIGRGAAGVTGQEEERKQTNNQKQNGTINKLQEGYSAIVALQCIQQVYCLRAQTPFASASHMQNYLIPRPTITYNTGTYYNGEHQA